MSKFPPQIKETVGNEITRAGRFGRTTDPAKYLVERRRFDRPVLSVPGGPEFEWPLGIEGVRIHGGATLAEHHYIGDDAVSLRVMHLDDRRLELTGMFPGLTGIGNVNDLLNVITAEAPDDAKLLSLPGINSFAAYVAVENYDFVHPEDDRTDSFTYTVTFRYTGRSTKRVIRIPVIVGPVNPTTRKIKPKGKSTRIYTVKAGHRTLRSVASAVYKNPDRWREIYNKNEKALQTLQHIDVYTPLHQMPTKPLPLGMKLNY